MLEITGVRLKIICDLVEERTGIKHTSKACPDGPGILQVSYDHSNTWHDIDIVYEIGDPYDNN